jgi:hypothetical protein
MSAVAFAQSANDAPKENLALVLIEPLDMANGVDEGVDAAQPVQVALSVGSGAAGRFAALLRRQGHEGLLKQQREP